MTIHTYIYILYYNISNLPTWFSRPNWDFVGRRSAPWGVRGGGSRRGVGADGIWPLMRIYTLKPASWHQAQENMNERCNLSQLNALFAEGKTHIPWPKIGATNLEAGPPILVLWPHFGSRIWSLFWGHKTQTGAPQYGQQVCYCRRKVTAAHIRDTLRVHAGEACFTTYLRLRFWSLGPT